MNNSYSLKTLFNVEKHTVIVTGANGQVGSEIVDALIDLGSKVIAVDIEFKNLDLDNINFGQPVFRGGLNYDLSKGWNIRTSFGQGFRFPTMTELYFKGDIGPISLYNNPNLKPEFAIRMFK